MDVALATCCVLPEPDPDAEPLLAALRARGLTADLLAWDDPAAPFADARLTLLRSTWNYPQYIDAFLRWAAATAEVSRLVNGLDVIRWNHDKRYLLELEAKGIPIAPTEYVCAGDPRPLPAILDARGWSDVVIKPAVSCGSLMTLRANGPGDARGEAHLRSLVDTRSALVQPYLASVEGHGERSLICIDGELTHAVRKSPRFFGDDEAISEAMPVADAERALAREVLRALEELGMHATYARVDVAPFDDGFPVLMELELMEPSLFFRQGPRACERLADAVLRTLNSRP